MKFQQTPRMIFSFTDGWDELIRIHPSIARLFTRLVLPLSLLPPAMMFYAAGHHGDVFVPGITPAQWHRAAEVFFVAELLTVPIMAWLIHHIGRINGIAAPYHGCFTLASIAPIPLWLSSLTLAVPQLYVGMLVGGLGLLGSVSLIYRGVYALFAMRDDIRALHMATVIGSAGLFMWLVLMQIMLVH